MPAPFDTTLDEDMGLLAAQDALPPDDTATSSDTTENTDTAPPVAPPAWKDVQGLPDFQKMTPENKAATFQQWVSQSNSYLTSSGVPTKQRAIFSDYVQKTAPAYGLNFLFNPDQTPMT